MIKQLYRINRKMFAVPDVYLGFGINTFIQEGVGQVWKQTGAVAEALFNEAGIRNRSFPSWAICSDKNRLTLYNVAKAKTRS